MTNATCAVINTLNQDRQSLDTELSLLVQIEVPSFWSRI